jgi:hypothetical protein
LANYFPCQGQTPSGHRRDSQRLIRPSPYDPTLNRLVQREFMTRPLRPIFVPVRTTYRPDESAVSKCETLATRLGPTRCDVDSPVSRPRTPTWHLAPAPTRPLARSSRLACPLSSGTRRR